MTATGVSPGRPPSRSSAATSARVAAPMRMTSVPPARASEAQSTAAVPERSPTRPVTTVTEVDSPRWVTGIPA